MNGNWPFPSMFSLFCPRIGLHVIPQPFCCLFKARFLAASLMLAY